MEKVKLKNTILFIGSFMVAVMFITSYAAFGNNNARSSTTTISQSPHGGIFVSGVANAIVVNYSATSLILINQKNYNSTYSNVSNYLAKLESNNTIPYYTEESNGMLVELNSSFNAYMLQQLLLEKFANGTHVNATVYIKLPHFVKFYSGTYGFNVSMPNRTYSISESPLMPLGSNVSVKINALANQSGFITPNSSEVIVQ